MQRLQATAAQTTIALTLHISNAIKALRFKGVTTDHGPYIVCI